MDIVRGMLAHQATVLATRAGEKAFQAISNLPEVLGTFSICQNRY